MMDMGLAGKVETGRGTHDRKSAQDFLIRNLGREKGERVIESANKRNDIHTRESLNADL